MIGIGRAQYIKIKNTIECYQEKTLLIVYFYFEKRESSIIVLRQFKSSYQRPQMFFMKNAGAKNKVINTWLV